MKHTHTIRVTQPMVGPYTARVLTKNIIATRVESAEAAAAAAGKRYADSLPYSCAFSVKKTRKVWSFKLTIYVP